MRWKGEFAQHIIYTDARARAGTRGSLCNAMVTLPSLVTFSFPTSGRLTNVILRRYLKVSSHVLTLHLCPRFIIKCTSRVIGKANERHSHVTCNAYFFSVPVTSKKMNELACYVIFDGI